MCDTLCVVDGHRLLFGKNSDRPTGEVQVVEHRPRRSPSPGELHTQYLDLGADLGAHACVASRPAWLWGFEHGLNEHGLAIGNEKIWTTDDPRVRPKALLGMDLVRLGLERAGDADEAVGVITELLQTHGQGGTGEEHADEPYDNAFLLADPHAAWIVETSDRRWAARRVTHGGAAISNRVSLSTNWDRASPGVPVGFDVQQWRALDVPTARADRRLAATTACISTGDPHALHAGAVVATLRDHGTGPWGDPRDLDDTAPPPPPAESHDDGRGVTVCMHVHDSNTTDAHQRGARGTPGISTPARLRLAPPGAGKTTTASMVCEVHADTEIAMRAWCALGSPCVGVYVPVFPPALPAPLADPDTWHAFDALRVRAEHDDAALAHVRRVLGPIEAALWADAELQWTAGTLDPAWPERAWAALAGGLHELGVT
jgi:hypothetical protein